MLEEDLRRRGYDWSWPMQHPVYESEQYRRHVINGYRGSEHAYKVRAIFNRCEEFSQRSDERSMNNIGFSFPIYRYCKILNPGPSRGARSEVRGPGPEGARKSFIQ